MIKTFSERLKQPNSILALLIVGAFLIRLFFILHHKGMWGVDGGAYLLSRNSVLGDEPTGTDFPRPPFAPGWLLVPFTSLLGDNNGLKAFALVVSFVLLPPYFLLIKRLFTPWQRVWAIGLLLADWNLAEMFTAGVLPEIGFAFMLLIIWAIIKLKEGWNWKAAIAIAFSLPAIPYTNQTSVALAAIALPAFVFGLGLSKPLLKRLALPVLIGIILALTAWPWYLAVAPGSDQLRYPGPLVAWYSRANPGWLLMPLAWFVGIYTFIKTKGTLRGFAIVILALSLFMPLRSYDETIQNIFYRARYLIMPFMLICIVWMVIPWLKSRWEGVRIGAQFAVACLTVLFALGYIFQLHAETKLGRMVTPETKEAISWLESQHEKGTILTNSYSLSLYVAGMTKQKTAWVQIWKPPKAYIKQHQEVSAILGWNDDDPYAAAQDLDAIFLLADTTWPSWDAQVGQNVEGLGSVYRFIEWLSPWEDGSLGYVWDLEVNTNPWTKTDKVPWLQLVWEKGNTKVWKILPA